MEAFTDDDIMPFGKHKGEKMEKVPASYLAWLGENGCNHEGVRKYIENSWGAIKKELPDRIFTR